MAEPINYSPAQLFSMRLLLNGIEQQQRTDAAATMCVPVVQCIPGRKVLVLAPHLDDEVLGCGGLISAYCGVGAEVTVLFVTCGSGGHAAECTEAREEARLRRREECERATACLGRLRSLFCDLPERKLALHLPPSDFLICLLRTEHFDAVFVPGPTEMHPDHIAVWRWVTAAFCDTHERVALYAYEVWGSCNPSVLLQMKPSSWEIKTSAMAAYRSQIVHLDYTRIMNQLCSVQQRFPWLAGDIERVEGFRLIERKQA